MTDYLEEHLGSAEALLKRIRQLEQRASGLSHRAYIVKNMEETDDYTEKLRDYTEKSEIVSQKSEEVDNRKEDVDKTENIVDEQDIDPKIREKRENMAVNRRTGEDDGDPAPEQSKRVPQAGESGTRTNAERAETSPPLSVQLAELDRAVSALAALSPESRETARGGWSAGGRVGGYPISLSGPRSIAVDPDVTGAPGEAWSWPGATVRADSAYGGARSWTEQADRIFRRDSRRYDGGFYLY